MADDFEVSPDVTVKVRKEYLIFLDFKDSWQMLQDLIRMLLWHKWNKQIQMEIHI